MRDLPVNFIADPEKCIRCGECVSDCPVNILMIGDDPPSVADGREGDCVRCQHCFAVCPTGAVSICGLRVEDSLSLAGWAPAADDLERLVRGRRSVRRYRQGNVDPALIRDLLETAWQAPSGRNARSVQFTVVDDRLVMDRLRSLTMERLTAVLQAGPVPPGFEYFHDIVRGWRDFRADPIFRWAPHLVMTSAPADSPAPEQDALIALSYFDLLAQSRGLGTLWNGTFGMALQLAPDLRAALGIPDDHLIGYSMSFGFPAVRYARTVQHREALIRRVDLPTGGPVGDTSPSGA